MGFFPPLLVFTLIVTRSYGAIASQNDDAIWTVITNDEFLQKVIIAGISAVLSFLVAWFVYVLQRRRLRKQIIYDFEERHLFPSENAELRRKFEIYFSGRKIEDILYVRCNIRNAGTTLVKDQRVSFSFPSSSTILEATYEPEPPPQIQVLPDSDGILMPNSKSFKISYFPRRYQMRFNFLVDTASQPCHVTVFGMSPENVDLEFVQGRVRQLEDDREKATRFLFLAVLSLLVPATFGFLPSQILDIIEVIIFILLLSLLKPFCRIVAGFLLKGEQKSSEGRWISVGGSVTGSILVTGDENWALVKPSAALEHETGETGAQGRLMG